MGRRALALRRPRRQAQTAAPSPTTAAIAPPMVTARAEPIAPARAPKARPPTGVDPAKTVA
jgi:hypothetical protein